MTSRRRWVLVLLCLGLGCFGLDKAVAVAEDVVQIRIVHRDVQDLLPMVQPLTGPYGYISADGPSNSLIVIDNPTAVARIQALVAKIDQPLPQLKIRFQYGQHQSEQEESAAVDGRIEVGDVSVGSGDWKSRPEGIDVALSSQSGQQRDRGEYTLVVRSGSTAQINSGYDVPYTQRWSQLALRRGHISQPVVFKKVDTGFDVRPVLAGNTVQMEITPRISYIGARGFRKPIRFAEAATRLNVPLGEWVEIAGTDTATEEIHRQILGGGRASGKAQLSMRVLVTRH